MKIIAEVRMVDFSASMDSGKVSRPNAAPITAASSAPSAPTSVGVAMPVYSIISTSRISRRLGHTRAGWRGAPATACGTSPAHAAG